MLSVFYMMDQRLYGNKILTWTHHHQVVYMEWRNLKLIMESYNLASPFTGGKSVNKDIAMWKFSLVWPCHKFSPFTRISLIKTELVENDARNFPINNHDWQNFIAFSTIGEFKSNLNFGFGNLMHKLFQDWISSGVHINFSLSKFDRITN